MKLALKILFFQKYNKRTSLVIQWLRFCASNAGIPGLIPGQGTRFHMLQLRTTAAKLKKNNNKHLRASLVVQWLRFCFYSSGA